jgi:hypothetical protein
MSGDLRGAESARERFFSEIEGNIGDLLMLARGAARGDYVDSGQLCRAAIAVMHNPPADEQLAAIADHLCQAAMDWAYLKGSRLRLTSAVRGYQMAASAIAADEIIYRLRRF